MQAPFGGITVVFGGDFRQILPVIVKGSREQVIAASLQRSPIWQHVNLITLRKNMRLEGASEENHLFAELLLKVKISFFF